MGSRRLSQAIDDPARRSTQQPVGLPAGLPLPDLDPDWSRVVLAPDAEGVTRRWHVLDNLAQLQQRGEEVTATLLCVHGNPTWSYLWRRVLAQAPAGWRVVAVDQLGMGWSERPGRPRTLAQRVEDLDRLTAVLQIGESHPVATLAHDWGGPISLGWALRHTSQLAGVVLTNTAVSQSADDPGPAVIRAARAPGVLAQVCRTTPAFVRATTALSIPPLPRKVRNAFAAPYRGRARREGVADFVRDIPFEPDHPSRTALETIASGLDTLAQTPALLVWGSRDPVFSQRYLEDLARRLPHAAVQRYPDASHLVLEDRPEGVETIWDWLRLNATPTPGPATPTVHDEDVPAVPIAVAAGEDSDVPAVVELGVTGRTITFGDLAARVERVAAGLVAEHGVRPGDRVAVLVPPGIELTTLVYALWRLGAVVVLADAGLGVGRLGAALRSAGPQHVIGIGKALALARLVRVPGSRISVETGGVELDGLASIGLQAGAALPDPEELPGSADGAVLFTSGATGPPKGVVYTRAGLGAQVALLREVVGFRPGERLVAAFAPFALYGPALGLTSAVPDMDVTKPHTLTADALAEAIAAVDASVVFAAPAALRNVVASAREGGLTAQHREALSRPRLLLSAGAPVPAELLLQVRELLTSAQTCTPYGMTEALPVAMLDPTTLRDVPEDRQDGVCVGLPVPRVQVQVAPLDAHCRPAETLTAQAGVLGEIVVRGAHIKDRYDRLWAQQHRSERPPGWHRTGDVGHLDDQGRVWVEGRLVHVLSTPDGPVTPYPVEDRVRTLPGVADVAAVGVGPVGVQQVVVVVVPEGRAPRQPVLAPAQVAAAVRAVAGLPVAAVLVRDWFPVDIRHASKVDRSALREWAEGVLHGRSLRARLGGLRGGAPTRRSR